MGSIVSIVEGHGEVEAFPVLLRSLAAHGILAPSTVVHRPIRIPRSKLVRDTSDDLERATRLAARLAQPDGLVLLLLDADDDAACRLGPALLARMKAARPEGPVAVVLAEREYEGWFLASADSLAPRLGVSPAPVFDGPESIRDAKGATNALLPDGERYNPVLHQARLSARLDPDWTRRRAPSFDKLCRELERFSGRTTP